jgi:WD40 repeat protein
MAERAYERLDPEQQRVARRIFLRLAGDEGDGVRVRRRVPLEELEADRVLDLLADSRLVTVSEGTAEVAHEALLREWPRLRGWLEEDAEGRRLHAHLTQAARAWSNDDRDRGELYRGARLASALEWRAAHEPELNTTEQQFLDASRVESERARRRIKLVLAGVLALLVLTAGAALLALDQRGQAREQTLAAEAQRLGAQALNADTLDFSLLLARQSVAFDDGPPTQATLLAALRRSPAAAGVMRPGISSLVAIELPSGTGPLAVSDFNGAVAFLDPATRRRLTLHRPTAGALGGPLVSAPDGSRLAAAGYDSQGGFVELFDPRTQRRVTQVRLNIFYTQLESAVFTPDSRELLVQANDPESGNELWRLDARTGRQLHVPFPNTGEGSGIAMPGDSRLLGFAGSRLVTYSLRDGATVIRDAATLRAERRLPFSGHVAELNPALGVVAFGDRDGSVRLLDLRTGRMRTAEGRHDAAVTALIFSADGRTLVTAGRDEQLIVWDTESGVATETLQARGAGIIEGLAVAPDGRTAFSAGRDGTVVTWDLQGDRRLERPLLVGGRSLGGQRLLASARGGRFAVVDREGSIDVFESRTLRFAGRIPLSGRHRPQGAAISPDGQTLAITDLEGRVGFWDLRTRRPLAEPQYGHGGDAPVVTFSGDGRWLVTGGTDDILRVWDARRHRMRDSFIFSGAEDLSLNPDGTLLAATVYVDDYAGGLQLLSVPALKVVRKVPAPRGTLARFTPDGRSLIYGDREGRVWIYDTRTWRPRGAPLFVSTPIFTAEISPDGRQLATTSADGEGRLWDIASGRPIGGALPSAGGALAGAAFIDGGRQMAVLHDRGGYAWDLRPATWARHACTVAGRRLTRAEWKSTLPDQRYAPACG